MAQADRVADMGTSRPAILEGCYLLLAQMPADPGLLLGYSLSAKANMLTGVAKKRASGKRKKNRRHSSLTYICIRQEPGCCADDSPRTHTVLLRACEGAATYNLISTTAAGLFIFNCPTLAFKSY